MKIRFDRFILQMDESLKKLIWDWAFRVEREVNSLELIQNPSLPDWVLDKITSIEPFRSQAIEDAKIYWAMPMPFGFGMELFLPEKIETSPFQDWQETIHNFTAQMEYCERMDCLDCHRYDIKLERIGYEKGEWLIIKVFNESELIQFRKAFDFFKQLQTPK